MMNSDNIIEEDLVDRPLVELTRRGAGRRRVEAGGRSRHSASDSIVNFSNVSVSHFPANVENVNTENSTRTVAVHLESYVDFDSIYSRGREVRRLDRMNSEERASGEDRIINNIIGSFDPGRQKKLRASYDLGHVKIRYAPEMDRPSTSQHSPNIFPHFSLFISRDEMEMFGSTPEVKGHGFNDVFKYNMNTSYGLHSAIQKNHEINVDDIRYYPEFYNEGIVLHRRIDYILYRM